MLEIVMWPHLNYTTVWDKDYDHHLIDNKTELQAHKKHPRASKWHS